MARPHRLFVSVVLAVGLAFVIPQRPIGQSQVSFVTAMSDDLGKLREWDRRVDQMSRAGELRLRETREDPLVAVRRHERYDQFYRGVPVWGGDITRQTDRGLTVSLFGALYDGLTLPGNDVQPTLSPE